MSEISIAPEVREAQEPLPYPDLHQEAVKLTQEARNILIGLPEYNAALAESTQYQHSVNFEKGGKRYDVSKMHFHPRYESIAITVAPSDGDKQIYDDPQHIAVSLNYGESPEEIENNKIRGVMSHVSWVTFESPEVYREVRDHTGKPYHEPVRDTRQAVDEARKIVEGLK